MKKLYPIAILLALFASSCSTPEKSSPNIIFILADDLGYGELGSYGQTKIETPNLDKLADMGMRFTDYYSGSPVCAPARCILLSGQHSGRAFVRGNDEDGSRGDVWNYRAMANDPYLEGQRPMADSVLTIAEVLQEKGYHTSLFGKWGLGYPGSESVPNTQGFDYFYGYNCQRQAHTLTPLHLWENDVKVRLGNDTLAPRTKLDEGADPYSDESYAKYFQPDYAPTKIFDALIEHVSNLGNEPFCVFWETPIPHLPLQAPKRWIDYYVDKFGEEPPYEGDKGYFPTRYPRATYAAMISYLDENVGKLLDLLEEKGELDNTVIFFSSDNGPSYTGGTDSPWFESGGPFKSEYGWGKGFLREGGIRVPLIVSWPESIEAGNQTNHISSAQDIFPTMCELAGIDPSHFNIDGISFLSTLTSNGTQKKHEFLYWEFPSYGGQVAVRKGNFKAYIDNMQEGNDTIQLFNLSSDIQEQINVADQYPNIIDQMEKIIMKEHTKSFNERWQIASLDD